ncbi:MAG: hypothetical protein K0S37_1644 [Microbacterium sp.]|nr:hypothetical protein [Microbacterium sp.]
MRSAELSLGRRFLVVLDPGEELISTLSRWAEENGIRSATVDQFFGAFRSIRLIAGDEPTHDPEPPLPTEVELRYLEGIGSGSISLMNGRARVHLHIAAGVKDERGLGYAGHVLSAETHYTVEVLVQEVSGAEFVSVPDPAAHGLPSLRFADAEVGAAPGFTRRSRRSDV